MEKRYPNNIMATACVPWTTDWQFDEEMFRRQVPVLAGGGINSIYLFGTAGEGYAVDDVQYMQIVRAFYDETRQFPDVLPMVGVICLSMRQMLQRIEDAAAAGIRDFQISFPSWGALAPDEIHSFFRMVCGAYPQLRFMHYNNLLRSRVKLTGADYIDLCKDNPNLVAVKQTGSTIESTLELMSYDLPLQLFFLEKAYGYACLSGEAALLISVSNVNLRLAREYAEAGRRRDAETLVRLDKEFAVCNRLLEAMPGPKIDGAYDKMLVKFAIPEFPHSLYPPYAGYTQAQFDDFAGQMRSRLPHWFE